MKEYKNIVVLIVFVLILNFATICFAIEDASQIDESTAEIMYFYYIWTIENPTADSSAKANELKRLCEEKKDSNITTEEQLKKLAKNYGDVSNRIEEVIEDKYGVSDVMGGNQGFYTWNRRYPNIYIR